MTNELTQTRRTKIVATLGPATDAPGMLERIISEGVDVVRLNLSHGQPDDHRARAIAVREAAAKVGREVGILADLQGPKIRIERFANGPIELQTGATFVLECRPDAAPGNLDHVGVSYYGLPHDVQAGDVLLLDDGLVALDVITVQGADIHCLVQIGGKLSDRKGLNRQGGGLSVEALSDKDRNDIKLAAEIGADFLAVSFVRSAADMNQARQLLHDAGGNAALVAKIERADAIPVLGEIIDASDVVMVARGDLGVEIGDAELPGLQKKIIRESVQRNRAVITATQMLQSMVRSPIPTRAEVLDVANAVIDGTDAVMLSEETAAGAHPDKAVAAMRRICLGAERQFEPKEDLTGLDRKIDRTDQAIALAAMLLASELGVRAIVALTESGATAQWLSRYRSAVPIYALSPFDDARRRMLMLRDVQPVKFNHVGLTSASSARAAVQQLFGEGKLSEGDRVVLTHGDHVGQGGGTNTLKLLSVGAEGMVESLRDL
ncbi:MULTISPECIES: pyruvate kinase [unclassified Rhodanobacter]|uniref:pyruvate kinase n=1 Tax=unclassified Rhodanobacter TaxID=2621553 RepID=UPI001607231F|nr:MULTISPECIES: pyruvate kinase [unclassified Rhodanobacter]MBB6242625.1 pyruvate kinase [Rhodanobacter sp. MP1X3]MBB6245164.1 pyruvate kinase [Rhodanobacter sp. A1T4]